MGVGVAGREQSSWLGVRAAYGLSGGRARVVRWSLALTVSSFTVFGLLSFYTIDGAKSDSNAIAPDQFAPEPANPLQSTAKTTEATVDSLSNENPHGSGNSSSVNVTVNGHRIAVPDNGSVNQTLQSQDGQTTSVSVQHGNSLDNQSGSHTRLNVSTHSSSTSTDSF